MNVLKGSASLVTAYLLAVSVFSASPISDIVRLTANAECQTIVNDTFWKDTNGNNIYSQGGGVFQFGDTYYWYGVHLLTQATGYSLTTSLWLETGMFRNLSRSLTVGL